MIQSLFYFLSFVAILSALLVITARNPVHSVLYLVLTFFAIFGHYILLNAQFLAIVHIIVYAGAIMVLFLFVIMLLNLNQDTEPLKPALAKIAGAVAGGLLLITFVAAFKSAGTSTDLVVKNPDIGLVKNLGRVLFDEFLLPFEVSSILLLVAMVGSVLLAKKETN